MLEVTDAYVKPHHAGALVTAGNPEVGLIVACVTDRQPHEAVAALEHQGIAAWQGAWSLDGSLEGEFSPILRPFIGAVAYVSDEDRPGLWVDAFEDEPTEVVVIEAMYNEFRASGQIEEITFEDFLVRIKPNVVVLTPEQQVDFALAKRVSESVLPSTA